MSFENLRLPATLIQAFYKDSLIDSQPNKPTILPTSQPENPVKFLGKNAKHILILVKDHDNLYLPDEDLQFLTGILGACKLSMADVALVNIHQENATAFPYGILAEKVLIFGVETTTLDLPVHFPHYQVQPHGPKLFLSGPPLNELAGNKLLKQQLWESLKKLFNL